MVYPIYLHALGRGCCGRNCGSSAGSAGGALEMSKRGGAWRFRGDFMGMSWGSADLVGKKWGFLWKKWGFLWKKWGFL